MNDLFQRTWSALGIYLQFTAIVRGREIRNRDSLVPYNIQINYHYADQQTVI